ncbi:hypothetical protein E4U43_008350 [Claviceps pusilla]|uniref:Gfd2/YDR514C-like C-terminal domain-containing protein n=1 Tax=Claviceps pusilla TaxID=123648 RepID=A0A9P7T0S4_9HYPO|nr:hypothetical protein E4U43_008350 [Claviceps pusilla]
MSDNQLQAQLDKLQEVLGKTITLDPSRIPTKIEPETSHGKTPSSSDWQEQHLGLDKSGGDAVPIHTELVADGPANPALDDSALCIGDSLEANVAFCPFKRIEQYPDQFIGKRNRPLFVSFLEEINAQLGTRLCIPKGDNEIHFTLKFGQGSTPRPRYIGPSQEKPRVLLDGQQVSDDTAAFDAASEEDRNSWLANWQTAMTCLAYQPADADQRARLAAERAEKRRRESSDMLNKVQARLGLSTAQQQEQQGQVWASTRSKPAVFVSIDIEVLEEEPRSMTEVGIAVLDTRNIHGTDGGPGGVLWWEHIEAHHLVVRQYASHVNHRYVQGCPDMFQFGSSTFPNEWDLIHTLSTILESHTRDPETDVFLVGHDIHSDVRYLASEGYDVAQALHSVGAIDTQILHQAWKAGTQARKLQRVLSDLCIPYSYLHNAGNDAMYTLRAMIAMGVEGPMPQGQTRRRAQLAGEHGLFDTGNKTDNKDEADELW